MDRVLALVYSLLATAVFVLVRDSRRLEDTEFLVALLVACACVFGLTVISGVLLRASVLRTLLTGAAAVLLVPLLYWAYIVVSVIAVCVIGGATCYS